MFDNSDSSDKSRRKYILPLHEAKYMEVGGMKHLGGMKHSVDSISKLLLTNSLGFFVRHPSAVFFQTCLRHRHHAYNHHILQGIGRYPS